MNPIFLFLGLCAVGLGIYLIFPKRKKPEPKKLSPDDYRIPFHSTKGVSSPSNSSNKKKIKERKTSSNNRNRDDSPAVFPIDPSDAGNNSDPSYSGNGGGFSGGGASGSWDSGDSGSSGSDSGGSSGCSSSGCGGGGCGGGGD